MNKIKFKAFIISTTLGLSISLFTSSQVNAAPTPMSVSCYYDRYNVWLSVANAPGGTYQVRYVTSFDSVSPNEQWSGPSKPNFPGWIGKGDWFVPTTVQAYAEAKSGSAKRNMPVIGTCSSL